MTFEVQLQRFRGFEDTGKISVRPITILVGANSAGKSSLLAGLRYLADINDFSSEAASFNKEPFNLGAYDQIAFNKAPDFSLSYKGNVRNTLYGVGPAEERRTPGEFALTFRKKIGQPTVSKAQVREEKRSISLEISDDWKSFSVAINLAGRRLTRQAVLPTGLSAEAVTQRPALLQYLAEHAFRETRDGQVVISKDFMEINRIATLLSAALASVPRISFVGAPVRSKPLRTYDPAEVSRQPEGTHVPSKLAQLVRSSPADWDVMRAALVQFGRESGLFSGLQIRSLGRSESDPFQILVSIRGPRRNLIDVGYGVSQSIPLVFELLERTPGGLFMAQQPEVHLHPEAQAALGTFVVREIQRKPGYIVLETHSDFLLDRIRRHVRNGDIAPDQVSLLYMYRAKGASQIAQVELDEAGDVIKPPRHYRDFFLREQFANLGFADVPHS